MLAHLYKDHLGSITHITNASGTVVERRSFDAWGRPRHPDNWGYSNIPAWTLLDRGYTGHEHLFGFDLINMNGRMYYPIIGRFLSPDPYVQGVGTQGFNRYTYALNNPLKFTDPTGYKWKWWQWALVGLGVDALNGGFTSVAALTIGASGGLTVAGMAAGVAGMVYSAAFTNTGFALLLANPLITGDDTGQFWNKVSNYWKIANGQLMTDKDLSFGKRVWQFVSRHTWEQPFTAFGFLAHNAFNTYGFYRKDETKVGHFRGATVMQAEWMDGGFSLGSSITMSNNAPLDYDNNLLLHEYGHYLQLRNYGGIPALPMSLSSLLSAIRSDNKGDGWHDLNWTERDAAKRSLSYFGNRMDNRQREAFEDYSGNYQGYYDGRFWRSYIFPSILIYLLWDNAERY